MDFSNKGTQMSQVLRLTAEKTVVKYDAKELIRMIECDAKPFF